MYSHQNDNETSTCIFRALLPTEFLRYKRFTGGTQGIKHHSANIVTKTYQTY